MTGRSGCRWGWAAVVALSLSLAGCGGGGSGDGAGTGLVPESATDPVPVVDVPPAQEPNRRTFAEEDRLAEPARVRVDAVDDHPLEFARAGTDRSISYSGDRWRYSVRGGVDFYASSEEDGRILTDRQSIFYENQGFVFQVSTDRRAGILLDIPGDEFTEGLLDYTEYGAWVLTFEEVNYGLPIVDMGAFARGVPTMADELPSIGTAAFRGYALAHETSGGILIERLVGRAELDVDFGSRRFDGEIDFSSARGWGRITFVNGRFPDGELAATAVSDVGHQGFMSGQFNGPSAEEAGGVYHLTGPSQVIGGFGVIRTP